MVATVSIPNLTLAVALNGSEITVMVQQGVTVRVPLSMLLQYLSVNLGTAPVRIVDAANIAMTADDYEVIVLRTAGAPYTTAVELPPTAYLGQRARVSDGRGDAGTNNILVSAPNGGTINGETGQLVMNADWGTTEFRALSETEWSIL